MGDLAAQEFLVAIERFDHDLGVELGAADVEGAILKALGDAPK